MKFKSVGKKNCGCKDMLIMSQLKYWVVKSFSFKIPTFFDNGLSIDDEFIIRFKYDNYTNKLKTYIMDDECSRGRTCI